MPTAMSVAVYGDVSTMYANESRTDMTSNLTHEDARLELPRGYSIPHTIIASFLVSIIMFVIVFGNLLVVIAISNDKNLKTTQNWFIASLAVADFLLGLVIMPFSLANEIMGYWYFGYVWCDLWKAIDVLLCTASILSICLISLDRYWSITRAVEYSRQRTPTRAAIMIAAVWLLSAVICVPPLIGWKNPLPVSEYPLCLLSDDIGYVLYSTMGSFYIPCVIMVFVYIKIFNAARYLARKNLKKKAAKPIEKNNDNASENGKIKLGTDIASAERVPVSCNTVGVATELNHTQHEHEFKAHSKSSTEKSKLIISDSDTDCRLTLTKQHSETDQITSDQLRGTETERTDHIEMSKKSCPCYETETIDNECFYMDGSESPSNSPPQSVTDAYEPNLMEGNRKGTYSLKGKPTKGMRNLSNSIIKKRPRPPTSKTKTSIGWRNASLREHERQKRKLAKTRERRATLVLGLIMAAFILCWFPFFTLYIITSFCYCIGEMVFAVAFWAGYCNSALNPIIYTVFNRDFRQAFHKIIFQRRF